MLSFFRLVVVAVSLQAYRARPHTEVNVSPLWRATLGFRTLAQPSASMRIMRTTRDTDIPVPLELRNSNTSTILTLSSEILTRRRRSSPGCGIGSEVRYRDHARYKFRVKGDRALFLAPTSSSRLTIRTDSGTDNQCCFRVHRFHVGTSCPGENGYVVVLETNLVGDFVTATASRRLAIMSGNSARSTTQIDSRFFRLDCATGFTLCKIKHIASNRFLSAAVANVRLASNSSSVFSDDMLFDITPCNDT